MSPWGERLFVWSRPLWIAVYAAGLFAFLSIAAKPVFGLGSVAFWLFFRLRADVPEQRLTRPVGGHPR